MHTQDTWDLSELYRNTQDPQIQTDLAQVDTFIAALQAFRGKIASLSPAEMLAFIQQQEGMSNLTGKVGLYTGLLEATNVADPDVTRFAKKIEEILVQKGTELIFIEVELAQIDEKTWKKHLSAPELAPYRTMLYDISITAKHTLTEPEEKIMAEKSQTSRHALTHLFSITTDTLTAEWDGEEISLTNLSHKIHDPDPAVRKKAALLMHETLNENQKTAPAIFNALVQDKEINDRLRHHDFPEEGRFQADSVDRDTVTALIEAVNKNFDLVTRYYTLKKKIFGVDELMWWDRYAPLPEVKTEISVEDAEKMVLDAFNAFNPRMAEVAQSVIAKNHIDWFPSPTKNGGAFCAYGTMGSLPYILMNYTKTPNDVMTLAHELGHAVHDVLAEENNVYFQAHPSLAVAEIASVFSESLLFERLMQTDISKEDKIALLMEHIEGSFATVIRQTTMFQFEQAVHTKRRAEGELSFEQLNDLWHDTMKAPYEGALTYTDEHKNTWMHIPHMVNTPFYVYSYAFAQLCVLALFKQYKDQGEKFVPTYLTLLKTGGSKSPKDNLAQAGLDITKPEFWQSGLDIIGAYIDDLEMLVNEK